MNNTLKSFLEKISDKDADEIWDWLDENPRCIEEMQEVITNNHWKI
jgi:hypothetical protein